MERVGCMEWRKRRVRCVEWDVPRLFKLKSKKVGCVGCSGNKDKGGEL